MLRWKDKLIQTEDKSKILKNSGAYFLLGLSVIAMTFFGICQPDQGIGVSGHAAKVGNEKITLQEFQREYNRMRDRFQQQYQENFDPVAMQLPKYVMKQIVDDRISFQVARLAGIEAQESDVIKLLKDMKAFRDDKGVFDVESYRRYLKGNGYSEASFDRELRRSISVQNFRRFVTETTYVSKRIAAEHHRLNESKIDVEYLKLEPSMVNVTVTDEDVSKFLDDTGKARVKTYFEQNAAEFNSKERVKARHILISFKGARSASGDGANRSKEDAKKKAHEALRQARLAGADFAKLAGAMTDEESGKTRGGTLGFFTREEMVKEFSDVAFNLAPGQISDVVESPFGFHVIKVEDKQAAKTTTLEEATPTIARKLIKEDKSPTQLKEKAESLIAALKEGKPIDAEMRNLNLTWQATGPMSISSGSFGPIGSSKETVAAVIALAKPGDVVPKVIESGANRFVVKLRSKQIADLATVDDKKKKELASTAASSSGYSLMSSFERSLKKELEDKGKIWENPQYLSLGQNSGAAESGG